MTLKNRGNKQPEPGTVDAYKKAIEVARGSDVEEERWVGLALAHTLIEASRKGENEADALMQSLSLVEAATKRIRAEMRAIHG